MVLWFYAKFQQSDFFPQLSGQSNSSEFAPSDHGLNPTWWILFGHGETECLTLSVQPKEFQVLEKPPRKVAELKQALQKADLPVTGKKAAMNWMQEMDPTGKPKNDIARRIPTVILRFHDLSFLRRWGVIRSLKTVVSCTNRGKPFSVSPIERKKSFSGILTCCGKRMRLLWHVMACVKFSNFQLTWGLEYVLFVRRQRIIYITQTTWHLEPVGLLSAHRQSYLSGCWVPLKAELGS